MQEPKPVNKRSLVVGHRELRYLNAYRGVIAGSSDAFTKNVYLWECEHKHRYSASARECAKKHLMTLAGVAERLGVTVRELLSSKKRHDPAIVENDLELIKKRRHEYMDTTSWTAANVPRKHAVLNLLLRDDIPALIDEIQKLRAYIKSQ